MNISAGARTVIIKIFWVVVSLALLVLILRTEFYVDSVVSDKAGDALEESQQEDTIFETSYEKYNNVYARVSQVIDGDTVYIESDAFGQISVRLIGINAPETSHPTKGRECYGEEAREGLEQLLDTHVGAVLITTDSTQDLFDRHERLLAYISVFENEWVLDVGAYMVEQGLAREYTYRNKYANQAVYQSAENRAKQDRVGMWSCA